MDMTFSIIIVVKNDRLNIEKTLLSCINQNYESKEIIVIDGMSNDGTSGIIDTFRHKVNTYVREFDSGIYNAMNKALHYVRGNWVIFMNSGDTFVNHDVLKDFSIRLNQKDKHIYSIVYGNVITKETQNRIIPPKINSKLYFINHTICHQSIIAKKDVFDSIGLFNEKYRIIADKDWLFRAFIKKFKYHYLDIDVTVWEQNGFSSNNQTLYNFESSLFKRNNFTFIERTLNKLFSIFNYR